METFKEYRIYNESGKLIDSTNSALAALLYQRLFFPKGKIELCYVTPLVIVATSRLVNLESSK